MGYKYKGKADYCMAETRNTKQKHLVFSLIENAKRPLTAGEIYGLASEQ